MPKQVFLLSQKCCPKTPPFIEQYFNNNFWLHIWNLKNQIIYLICSFFIGNGPKISESDYYLFIFDYIYKDGSVPHWRRFWGKISKNLKFRTYLKFTKFFTYKDGAVLHFPEITSSIIWEHILKIRLLFSEMSQSGNFKKKIKS